MSEHTTTHASANGVAERLRDVTGGVTATLVLITQMLTLGLIAYGALGPSAVEAGVRAAFAAAIYGLVSAIVLGGALLPNEIPRASTVLVFAAFVTRLAGDPVLSKLPGNGVAEILFLSALCLLLAGFLQIAFGVLRLGSIARFVPYPVVAGLMTGLAISLFLYELPHILGVHHETPATVAEAPAAGHETANAPEAKPGGRTAPPPTPRTVAAMVMGAGSRGRCSSRCSPSRPWCWSGCAGRSCPRS
jgi:MFS superfamily sulfate permease-like transporter